MGIPEWQIRIAMERGMIDLLCVLPPDELRDKGIPFVMDLLFGRITKAKQDKKMTLKEVALWRSFFIGYIGGWWLDEKRIHTWSMYNKVSSKFDLYACMYQISLIIYIYIYISLHNRRESGKKLRILLTMHWNLTTDKLERDYRLILTCIPSSGAF